MSDTLRSELWKMHDKAFAINREICRKYVYIDKVKNFLEADGNVLFAYVFGSHVTGFLRKASDLDVAVYFKHPPEDVDELVMYISELENLCDRRVDLVVLNKADPLLKREVVNKGALIVCKDRGILAKFKERLMSELEEFYSLRGWIY